MNLPPLVVPFVGERYAASDRLSRLIAPPYDVISPAERAELAAADPCNVVRVILPEGGTDRYRSAAAILEEWRRSSVLVRDPEPAVWVVRHEYSDSGGIRRSRTGFIGALAVEPFATGRVRPHERTHRGPKEDRLALLRATRTMCEALLVVAPDPAVELATALEACTAQPPFAEAEFQKGVLRLWRVAGAAAAELCRTASQGKLYIADGHHRYETALAFKDESPGADRTLALIVSVRDPGLLLLPTHRLVYGGAVEWEPLRERLSRWFRITPLQAPPPQRDLVLALRGPRFFELSRLDAGWEELEDLHPAVRDLAVAWADRLVLPLLLQGGDGRVAYTSRAEEVMERLAAGEASAGLLLSPPTVEQVLEVADAQAAMPQKSTYFFPKVPSGLVMLNLADSGG
ncbi:MAG: hypothetical protein KatS3mg081_2239 [Gemmatimonadales bacterium]|nr:MAG: hypothetical protein KatS3mg081_2239 [Gemmatimonadales bacterium]